MAAGALAVASKALYILSVLHPFIKSTTLPRYAHQTDGKPPWALVTGASGGIGKELSHELALQGFNVVLHGRTASKLEKVKEDLQRAHSLRSFRILIIDVSCCVSQTTTLAADVLNALGDINLTAVINNAGGATDRSMGPLDTLSAEKLVYDASVNALFPTLLLHAVIPLLNRNAPALVINTGSLPDIGMLNSGSYAASKTYLAKITETVSREMDLQGREIEVFCVRVGNVWGTNQTLVRSQDIFAPDASTMAKAVLARVGCGKRSIAAYWGHALLLETINALPGFAVEYGLASLARAWDDSAGDKKD